MKALAFVVLLAACGSSSSEPQNVAGCDQAGLYRLRFHAAGQWMWFRFRLDPQGTATLVPPIALDSDGQILEATPGPGCALDVTMRRKNKPPMLARLELDPKTNAVKGKLRTKGVTQWELEGVRDPGPQQATKHACVRPGRYELVVPNEQTWTSSDTTQSCERATLTLPFLVEYVGDKLVIDQLDPQGDAAWAGEDVYELAPCQVEVRLRHFESYVYARLVFDGDRVTATASSTSVQLEHGGRAYRCVAYDPMIWVQRASET